MLSLLSRQPCLALPFALLATALVTANPSVQLQKPHVKADLPVVSSASEEVFFEQCPQGWEWAKYSGSCYRWFRNESYWYTAEQSCKKLGGQLTSIGSRFEDSFIAKLTYCRRAWIGRYAVNVDLLNKPENYRFTDGIKEAYHKHNFIYPDIHYPLITVFNLTWENNVYHDRHSFICKVKAPEKEQTCDCPTGWRQLNGNCYLMPGFNATYIEADFYCRGRDAYVTSIQSSQELRALSLLDIETYGCPPETWIGLLKLNPCREDFSTAGKICYRWSDRSGDYKGIPAWQAGSPIEDRETNCIVLRNEEIASVPCHTRAKFVCKKKVDPRQKGRQCTA